MSESQQKVQEVIQDIPTVISETRTGYKTTEFWITVASALAVALDGVPIPDKYQGPVVGLIAAAYIISRGVAKKGVPDVKPEA